MAFATRSGLAPSNQDHDRHRAKGCRARREGSAPRQEFSLNWGAEPVDDRRCWCRWGSGPMDQKASMRLSVMTAAALTGRSSLIGSVTVPSPVEPGECRSSLIKIGAGRRSSHQDLSDRSEGVQGRPRGTSSGDNGRACPRLGRGLARESVHTFARCTGSLWGRAARTIAMSHPMEAVYYLIAGSAVVEDLDQGTSDQLIQGSMFLVDPGTTYRVVGRRSVRQRS